MLDDLPLGNPPIGEQRLVQAEPDNFSVIDPFLLRVVSVRSIDCFLLLYKESSDIRAPRGAIRMQSERHGTIYGTAAYYHPRLRLRSDADRRLFSAHHLSRSPADYHWPKRARPGDLLPVPRQ